MRAQAIDVKQAKGKALCSTISRADGKKLLAKGHVISHDDARMLEDAGLCHVWVFELEEGETGEDEAVLKVAAEIACGSCEINLAAGGRANLIASEPCCVLLDDGLLRQINSTASINVATSRNFSFAKAAQRIATVKSAPFVVTAAELDALLSILRERGPVLQARPIRKPTVGVLYTDPSSPDRARQLFEDTLGERLQRLGAVSNFALTSLEQEDAIALCLRRLLYVRPTCILIASTTVPAGPDDAVGRGMNQAACAMVRFLAPVDPGNFLLLGYHDLVPVVSAPGCFRSAKRNVLDLILPPMLARYRLNDWEIAGLGHGGLLA